MNKIILFLTGLSLPVLPALAVVNIYTGSETPDSSALFGSTGLSHSQVFTAHTGGGTGWASDGDELIMATGTNSSIYFGYSVYTGDVGASFLSPSTSDIGTKLKVRAKLGALSDGFHIFLYDGSGNLGWIWLRDDRAEFVESGQSIGYDFISFSDFNVGASPSDYNPEGFDITEYHDYSIHLYDGQLQYEIDGNIVYTGAALNGGATVNYWLIGDYTGSASSGLGTMGIDSVIFDNAAGAIVPEASNLALCFGLIGGVFSLGRRGNRRG